MQRRGWAAPIIRDHKQIRVESRRIADRKIDAYNRGWEDRLSPLGGESRESRRALPTYRSGNGDSWRNGDVVAVAVTLYYHSRRDPSSWSFILVCETRWSTVPSRRRRGAVAVSSSVAGKRTDIPRRVRACVRADLDTGVWRTPNATMPNGWPCTRVCYTRTLHAPRFSLLLLCSRVWLRFGELVTRLHRQ